MQGSDHDRQAVADQLQSLSLPELVDVLRRVLPAYGDDEGRNGMTHRLVLAEATVFDETVPLTADDPPVIIEVVAWPDRDFYDGGFGPEPTSSSKVNARGVASKSPPPQSRHSAPSAGGSATSPNLVPALRVNQTRGSPQCKSRGHRRGWERMLGSVELVLPCPCCGYRTMKEAPGSYDTCPVCWWEDDLLQLRWPQLANGANNVSLIEGQRNFARSGSCTGLPPGVELADPNDYDREPHWRPIDLSRDTFEPPLCQLAAWPDDLTTLYWWRYRDAGAWRRR